jgi:hypothetical protein
MGSNISGALWCENPRTPDLKALPIVLLVKLDHALVTGGKVRQASV